MGGGTSKAAKVVLAGVVGLLEAGLILLMVALASRRRIGVPPGPGSTTASPAPPAPPAKVS